MNQKAHVITVRKTIEIDTLLANQIQELADEKKWSFSYMGSVLLQQAMKERQRKSRKSTNQDKTAS